MQKGTQNTILFLVPALIWGATWYAIKFQLGVVSPVLSVCYRFALAGLLMFLGCFIFKLPMKFKPIDHFLFAAQGFCLFGVNYWFVYMAEQWLASGLIAVFFSLVLFTNMFFSALVLKIKISSNVFIGAILGVLGTYFIFRHELSGASGTNKFLTAAIFCLLSLLFASFGNVLSGYNQKRGLPVVQTNAYGMLYGALLVLIIAFITRAEFKFDMRPSYLISLFYLSIFGSIIAFTSYLKLLGRIGPSKSAYVVVIVPMLAMVISTVFENYSWQKSSLIGMPILITGNLVAMGKLKIRKNKTNGNI